MCIKNISGLKVSGRRLTFGHVRQLVLAHGLESGSFELALELGWDAEEVYCQSEGTYYAGKDG